MRVQPDDKDSCGSTPCPRSTYRMRTRQHDSELVRKRHSCSAIPMDGVSIDYGWPAELRVAEQEQGWKHCGRPKTDKHGYDSLRSGPFRQSAFRSFMVPSRWTL